ncbi:hypothetical protein ECDEC6B_2615 [Escherichia coli DEC6B]|nr:hypothetical protein ECDEC6B_2615 [Escherichia coli DEC6B]
MLSGFASLRVAVEADDAALSADFPAAVALAEACPGTC